MKTITFDDQATFLSALASLETNATPRYVVESDTLTILTDDVQEITELLLNDGIDGFVAQYLEAEDEPFDGFRTDAEADSDALRSAGFDDEENYCPSFDSFGED